MWSRSRLSLHSFQTILPYFTMLSFYIYFLISSFLIHLHKLFSMQLGPSAIYLAYARLIVPFISFIVNLFGNSFFLNILFFLFCLWTFFIFHQYSLSNSSTPSFVFPRFSIPSQVFDSVINPFHHTKYLSFPLTYHLFSILSTFHSFSFLIMTQANFSFLCSFTCPIYLHILLIFTTRCIFTILSNSNLTIFDNITFFTL